MIRKIAAHYIFTGIGIPLKQGVIHLDSDGTVLKVIDTEGRLNEESSLEYFDGVIVPGMINAHTHLELSHLKGAIPQKTGLINFISNISRNRDVLMDSNHAKRADESMYRNGIVAVGDISNTTDSFLVKQNSNIRYRTFVEVFGVQDEIADVKMKLAQDVFQMLKLFGLEGHISPHAPYSVSTKLWEKLLENESSKHMISIHNQECIAENDLFERMDGDFVSFLSMFSNDFEKWDTQQRTSLHYCLQYYKKLSQILLVHNTFTSQKDIDLLQPIKENVTFVLCPNANLYIENRLPDILMLAKSGIRIALGTDSLASNGQLSILEEMKTIQNYFPEITFEQLVTWATANGAKALGYFDELGSIEIGKKPRLNVITGMDFREMKLTSQSKIKMI